MRYRRLGRTRLDVSVVGVGTWQFGGEWGREFSQSDADAVLGRAAELGINLVDTAECYGDHLSERLVGKAIRRNRDHWIVATKFGHRFGGHLEREQLWRPADVRKQLEDSLRALGVEAIDLYQFHSGTDVEFDEDGLWEMLGDQVRAGKVRHLGVSLKNGPDPMHQLSRGVEVGVGAIQLVYNRLSRRPESLELPFCQEHDLGVLARVPLASGLLSGKYRPGTQFDAPSDVRSSHDRAELQARLDEVERIRTEEVPAGVEMASWALAWCLRHPAVSCVIPGCKSVAQVEANARAAELVSG